MKAASHILDSVSKSVASRLRNYSPLLGILRPHVEYCTQFSTPQYKTDIQEQAHQKGHQDDKGAEAPGVQGQTERTACSDWRKGNPIAIHKYLMAGNREN